MSDPHLPLEWYMAIEDCCAQYDIVVERKRCQIDWCNDQLLFNGWYGTVPLVIKTIRLLGDRTVQVIAMAPGSTMIFFRGLWHCDTGEFTDVDGPRVGDYLLRR